VSLLPEGHRCRRTHGHSFVAKVRADHDCDKEKGVVGLAERLRSCIAPLDYRLLNEMLEQPTDENLARWIRRKLDVVGIKNVGLQSTANQGVDMDEADHVHIWRRFRFEAAHQLPNVPPGHKCGRMHGHGFEVILHADRDLDEKHIGIDFDHLATLWEPIYREINYACLNNIQGLENPTSELISSWLWERLKPQLPELSWVTVYETATCGAHFDGQNYRIWKEMTFDNSLRLKRGPERDPRRGVHGHTYLLRLHLNAPLDRVMGWTIDFGDVKEIFSPIFKALDHQPLHEIADMDDCDPVSIVRWIKNQAQPMLSQLDRVDLYETRGCGAILSWNKSSPALPV
jgi:6-pyruvoyltetrahydropterin/6-carboxytetrahydropterin synthase